MHFCRIVGLMYNLRYFLKKFSNLIKFKLEVQTGSVFKRVELVRYLLWNIRVTLTIRILTIRIVYLFSTCKPTVELIVLEAM